MNIHQRLVEHFGTQDLTAKALGVHQTTVSDWVRGKCGMGAVPALIAEQVTDGVFKAVDLCPSLKRAKSAA
ncbi:DNA-binding transcriptional regulator Cro [Azotobacter beijerinckii]|uniref:DNA-binding transcriptional regulator Cro n=1 Tax=Azotobacter beijerinckii TaxID=170623 RepID=A0A1H6ZI35_9GAMM|nr:YdaS family helix-turn-helix protein [Azotobacter beijerinckii]SEJ53089.1 DNA-binding transcriptional regulator Cro [Azotobacter beijerinckii]